MFNCFALDWAEKTYPGDSPLTDPSALSESAKSLMDSSGMFLRDWCLDV
jgi:hypothetical protein